MVRSLPQNSADQCKAATVAPLSEHNSAAAVAVEAHGAAQVSVIIPYYNEDAFLPATLRSLLAQAGLPLHFILVDNASTDGSTAAAHEMLDEQSFHHVTYAKEARPGKTHALETGLSHVATPYFAICDADTLYPAHYMKTALAMLQPPGISAAFAYNGSAVQARGETLSMSARLWPFFRARLVPFLLRRQCHAGGYGQVYRTAAVQAAGGISGQHWPYILEDHELPHRVLRHGNIAHDVRLFCFPDQTRRQDRTGVTWTLLERIAYHITPYWAKDWLFYDFLASRFAARGLYGVKLRQQTWKRAQGPQSAPQAAPER